MFCVVKKRNCVALQNQCLTMDCVYTNEWHFTSIFDASPMKGIACSGISVYLVIFLTKKRRDKFIRERIYSSSRAIRASRDLLSQPVVYGFRNCRKRCASPSCSAHIESRAHPRIVASTSDQQRAIDISPHSARVLPKYIGNFPIRMPKIPRVEPSLALFVRRMRDRLSTVRSSGIRSNANRSRSIIFIKSDRRASQRIVEIARKQ